MSSLCITKAAATTPFLLQQWLTCPLLCAPKFPDQQRDVLAGKNMVSSNTKVKRWLVRSLYRSERDVRKDACKARNR